MAKQCICGRSQKYPVCDGSHNIKNDTESKEIINNEKWYNLWVKKLLHFSAPSWCVPCQKNQPFVDEFILENPDIEYKYIDKPEEYTGPLDEDEEYYYGMFEGSEEEFNNTYYAPDLDEYGDEDTPYHPPWVTLEDLEYDPDAKYEPLPHTTTISEDISRQKCWCCNGFWWNIYILSWM